MQPLVESKIQLLPEHIIDQIKAGEVIERPSSLIKELLENAIDAGPTQIQIHVLEQGLKLIEVTDNGHGMSFHDLPFAFCRHATSKISTFEDLYQLLSFGFRGEALASMASISKITCVSHTAKGTGGKIVMNGGLQELHVKDDSKISGTSFYVRDLFYNTPVRLKFIKSKNSEQNAIKKIVEAFLLSYPQIEFHVRYDDKDKEIYKASSRWERIQDVYSVKVNSEKSKIELKKEYLQNSLELLMLAESSLRPGQKFQFIFVNNRLITDRQIHAVINSFSETLIPGFKLSNYCLFLQVPAEDLDANVHPNKTFVKFKNFGAILGLISASLKNSMENLKTEITEKALPLLNSAEMSQFKDLHAQVEDLYEEEEMPKHFSVTPAVTLVQKNQQFYLLHLGRLLAHYAHEKSTTVVETVPILISEPYNLKKSMDNILDDLTKLGFEFDRLSEHSVVLRSLPEWLIPLNYKALLFYYFDWAQATLPKKGNGLLNFLASELPHEFFDAKTKSFLIQEFTENNHQSEWAICLDATMISKLFK